MNVIPTFLHPLVSVRKCKHLSPFLCHAGKQCVMVDRSTKNFEFCVPANQRFLQGNTDTHGPTDRTQTHGPDTSTRILRNRRGKKGRGKLPFGSDRSLKKPAHSTAGTRRSKGQRGHKGRAGKGLWLYAHYKAKGEGQREMGAREG